MESSGISIVDIKYIANIPGMQVLALIWEKNWVSLGLHWDMQISQVFMDDAALLLEFQLLHLKHGYACQASLLL